MLSLDKTKTFFMTFKSSRTMPVPRTTAVSGSSVTLTAIWVSVWMTLANPRSKAPPPDKMSNRAHSVRIGKPLEMARAAGVAARRSS